MLLCLGLQGIADFIQSLDVLFIIRDGQLIIFLLLLRQLLLNFLRLLLLSLLEWFLSRAGPAMISKPFLLEVSKVDLEVLRLSFERPLDWELRYVAHEQVSS